MKSLLNKLFILSIVVFFASGAFSQSKAPTPTPYQNVLVENFTVESGVEFSPEQMKSLMADIVLALTNTKKFDKVALSADKPEFPSDQRTLKIVGEVVKYKKGNRAARYFIGFGAGATKVNANVKFMDLASGSILLEREVDGVVWIGLFGGESGGAKSGLAKEISNLAKKQFGAPKQKT